MDDHGPDFALQILDITHDDGTHAVHLALHRPIDAMRFAALLGAAGPDGQPLMWGLIEVARLAWPDHPFTVELDPGIPIVEAIRDDPR